MPIFTTGDGPRGEPYVLIYSKHGVTSFAGNIAKYAEIIVNVYFGARTKYDHKNNTHSIANQVNNLESSELY